MIENNLFQPQKYACSLECVHIRKLFSLLLLLELNILNYNLSNSVTLFLCCYIDMNEIHAFL